MLPNLPAEGEAGGAGCAKVLSHVKGIRGDTGLNHRTSRGGGYGRETGIIDLGHEPPLSVAGCSGRLVVFLVFFEGAGASRDRRDVSRRPGQMLIRDSDRAPRPRGRRRKAAARDRDR